MVASATTIPSACRRPRGRLGDDDPERLAPAEFDEDGLARFQVAQRVRDEVRVGPVAAPAGRVDRDFDGADRATGSLGLRGAGVGRPGTELHGVRQGQGDRG